MELFHCFPRVLDTDQRGGEEEGKGESEMDVKKYKEKKKLRKGKVNDRFAVVIE